MGLSSKVSLQVQKAMQKVGDLATLVDYNSIVVGAYNETTDVVTKVTTTYEDVTAVEVALSEQEVDYFAGNRNTLKLLIAALDLAVAPKVEDTITINGALWEVKRVKAVPGNSLHIIFVQST